MSVGKLDNQPKCPKCGVLIDGFGTISEEHSRPRPGDLSVCAYCDTPLQYTAEMELRLVDVSTLHPVNQEEIRQAIEAVQEFRAMRRRMN